MLDWDNQKILESVRQFILEDCGQIKGASRVGPVDAELAKISADAMIDLLCIRYHNEAIQRCENYSLTYKDLCKRI